jgi:SAM-dependent methyltransferase
MLGQVIERMQALLRRDGVTRRAALPEALPVPPAEMRALVGPTELAAFENPSGGLVFPYLAVDAYHSVFDFGCGCGRVARQLLQQDERPQRYLGVDLHAGMIRWCQENLTPRAPEFEFVHHDVFDDSFNPGEGKPRWTSFPAADGEFTLVNAISVFTHLTEVQVAPYLQEAARVLSEDGVVHASFFLLDKRAFPFMQPHTNALYVSWEHPSAAVVFDRGWIFQVACDAGLTVVATHAPQIHGYQWVLEMRHARLGLPEAELPVDSAPLGEVTIPPMPVGADRIGL